MIDLKKKKEVLDLCKQIVKELSEFQPLIMEYSYYLKRFVDAGIVPSENMGGSLNYFFSVDRNIEALSELICDYINNLECIEENSSFTSRIVLLNKEFISDLQKQFSKGKFSDIGDVIRHTMNVVDYWCKQKWLDGSAHGLKDSDCFFENRYENLMRLLFRLKQCLLVYVWEE